MTGGSKKELAKELLKNKEFRHFWSETYLRENIPFQLKTLRTERGLNQIEAGELLGKGQNGLSRLESPAYGRLTLQTLLEVARGYDVGLIVKFVPFSRLLREYEDVSFAGLSAPSPTSETEIDAINSWADEGLDSGYWEAGGDEVSAAAIATFDLGSLTFGTDRRAYPPNYERYLDWIEGGTIGELDTSDRDVTWSGDLILT